MPQRMPAPKKKKKKLPPKKIKPATNHENPTNPIPSSITNRMKLKPGRRNEGWPIA